MSKLPRFVGIGAMLLGVASIGESRGVERASERQVLAFTYPEGQVVSLALQGTSRLPDASGNARVLRKAGSSEIVIELEGMRPAAGFGGQLNTYTLWIVTPEGRVENAGEVILGGSRSRLEVSTPLDAFGMLVTAEPHFLTSRPSRFVVLETTGPAAEAGTLQVSTIRYEGFDDVYDIERESLTADADIEVSVESDVGAARAAVELAEAAGAAEFAESKLAEAKEALRKAEVRFSEGIGEGERLALSRDVIRLAVAAENEARERAFEGALARERRASSDRLSSLERAIAAAETESERNRLRAEQEALDAELEAKARAEAEREAAEAARRAAEAEGRAHAAEENRLAAEEARLEAERAKAEAERRRLTAEREAADARLARENARAELREAMASITAVRESARGLIVSLPNILFATNQASLKPEGREALAKISGVLHLARGYTLSVEGHTDSVGSAEQNLALSEKRAASVRDYLVSQGVPSENVVAKGLGESQPISSNATATGRQENRRVEIIVLEAPDFGLRPSSN